MMYFSLFALALAITMFAGATTEVTNDDTQKPALNEWASVNVPIARPPEKKRVNIPAQIHKTPTAGYVASGPGWEIKKVVVTTTWLNQTNFATCDATCLHPFDMEVKMTKNGVEVPIISVYDSAESQVFGHLYSASGCEWAYEKYVAVKEPINTWTGGVYQCSIWFKKTRIYTSPNVKMTGTEFPYGLPRPIPQQPEAAKDTPKAAASSTKRRVLISELLRKPKWDFAALIYILDAAGICLVIYLAYFIVRMRSRKVVSVQYIQETVVCV